MANLSTGKMLGTTTSISSLRPTPGCLVIFFSSKSLELILLIILEFGEKSLVQFRNDQFEVKTIFRRWLCDEILLMMVEIFSDFCGGYFTSSIYI